MIKNEKAKKVVNFFKWTALICFIVACGSCVACNASREMTIGDEEFYVASGGKIKYGGKMEFTGGEPFLTIGAFSIAASVVFAITGGIIYGRFDE